MTDRLRLKQVCLNLARNSVKFIDKGFIRLRAEVIDNEVHVFIEDSGSGIPEEKKGQLFRKFQESLDSLSQGTVR
jgi:signal transduction histidine kinase